jgi:hypothetical protein
MSARVPVWHVLLAIVAGVALSLAVHPLWAQIPAGTVNVGNSVTVTNSSDAPDGIPYLSRPGPVVKAPVFDSTPVLTPGSVAPFSLTVLGALRVDSSGVIQPVSGTVTITPSGTQTVAGTVTANQGTASAQTAAGWPVQPWGMSDSVFAGGEIISPVAAGAPIATIAAGSLPAGTYRVDLYADIQAAAGNANDIEFRTGAVVRIAALGGNVSAGAIRYQNIRVTLDGATALSLNATAGAAAGGQYVGQIIATRIF